MPRRKSEAPGYRYHVSGQAVVNFCGKNFYLGPFDTPESRAKYYALLSEYHANGMTDPPSAETHQGESPVTVRCVTPEFREHAKERYASSPKEKARHDGLCDLLELEHGDIPAESMAWHREKKREARQTPEKYGNRPGTNRKENPRKQPGEKYEATSYRRAIERAAKAAKTDHWFPYQLRHTAARVIREALGFEAAQAVLGHSHAAMTEHYAKQTLEAAIRAAAAGPSVGDKYESIASGQWGSFPRDRIDCGVALSLQSVWSARLE